MIKLLKSNKGFALTELLVAMLIFSVIVTSVTAIFPAIFAQFEHANELAESNTLLNNLANQIISDLSNATETPVITEDEESDIKNELSIVTGKGTIKYTIDEASGILLKNESASGGLRKDYYKRKSVRFSCVLINDSHETAYMLTVKILSDKRGSSISRDYAIAPIILNQ